MVDDDCHVRGEDLYMKKIYLASPYTGTEAQQIGRYRRACQAAADIIRLGHNVFSPIAHSHGIAVHGGLKGDHSTWKEQNAGWIEWCDELWVLTIDGWDGSIGIEWEMEMARIMGKRVEVFL